MNYFPEHINSGQNTELFFSYILPNPG